MKPLNKAIRAAQLEGLDWREEIYTFLLAYRTTPQCSTGVAPAQLLFNREVRSTIPMSPEKREVVYKELHNKAKKMWRRSNARQKHMLTSREEQEDRKFQLEIQFWLDNSTVIS